MWISQASVSVIRQSLYMPLLKGPSKALKVQRARTGYRHGESNLGYQKPDSSLQEVKKGQFVDELC